jgi:uncharacterized protein (DUF362 family)
MDDLSTANGKGTNASITSVFLARCPSYATALSVLQNALDVYPEFLIRLKAARRVLLKPNVMGRHRPETGRTTHPEFVRALVLALRSRSPKTEFVLGDGAGPGVDTLEAFRVCGIASVASELGVSVQGFTGRPTRSISVSRPCLFDQIEVVAELDEYDLIVNVPKLKTTYASPVGGMKNLMGLVSQEYRYLFHACGLQEGIADMAAAIPTALTVVDGIIGCELRWPVNSGVIIAGEDPVATDAVCAEAMGIDIQWAPSITLAASRGVGVMDPERRTLVGPTANAICRPFAVPPVRDPASLSTGPVTVVGANPCCIGCVGTIQKGLDDLARDGTLGDIVRPIRVVVGADWASGPDDPNSVLLVGNCAAERRRTWPSIVRGSPPLIHRFSQRLLEFAKNGI